MDLAELAAQHKILEHSSMILIERGNSGKGPFIFSQYDAGYPRPAYRGRINLMGGAQEFETVEHEGKKLRVGFVDLTPYDAARREASEEIRNPRNQKGYARHILMMDLREAVIDDLINDRIADFFDVTHVPEKEGKPGSGWDYVSIDTFFRSAIDPTLFDEVRRALGKGRRIVNEGNLAIVTADNLVKGNHLCAWTTGAMMEDYLGIQIPNPEGNITVKIPGLANKLFAQYRNDPIFKYVPLDKRPAA